jgi:hypothetical protein
METKTKKITNFQIVERQDIKGNDYFIIFDNDEQSGSNAYFCWKESVKTGFNELVNNKHTIKELEIEWEPKEKGNKVVSVWTDNSETDFLI